MKVNLSPVILCIVLILFTPVALLAQNLGSLFQHLNRFSVWSDSSISTTDTISAYGDVGYRSSVSPVLYNQGNSYTPPAQEFMDALAEFNTIKQYVSSLSGSSLADTLSGVTLSSGIYTKTGSLVVDSLVLTGNSSSEFIFYIDGDARWLASSRIILNGNINPANIVWFVNGQVQADSISELNGRIMSSGGIQIQSSWGYSMFYSLGSIDLGNYSSPYDYPTVQRLITPVTPPEPCDNLIVNSGFDRDPYDNTDARTQTPFALGLVDGWGSCIGTAGFIEGNPQKPLLGTYRRFLPQNQLYTEDIYQNVNIISGERYIIVTKASKFEYQTPTSNSNLTLNHFLTGLNTPTPCESWTYTNNDPIPSESVFELTPPTTGIQPILTTPAITTPYILGQNNSSNFTTYYNSFTATSNFQRLWIYPATNDLVRINATDDYYVAAILSSVELFHIERLNDFSLNCGESMNVGCNLPSIPGAIVSWIWDGTIVPNAWNQSEITILNDENNIVNFPHTLTRYITLPNGQVITDVITVTYNACCDIQNTVLECNETVLIGCDPPNVFPGLTVSWLFDGVSLVNPPYTPQITLTNNESNPYDVNHILTRIITLPNGQTITTTINLTYKACCKLPEDLSIACGDSIAIGCDPTVLINGAVIEWTINGVPVNAPNNAYTIYVHNDQYNEVDVTQVVTYTITLPNGQVYTQSVDVILKACCRLPLDITMNISPGTNDVVSDWNPIPGIITFTGNQINISGGTFFINGTLYIDKNTLFSNSLIILDTDAKIIVQEGHALDIYDNSVLRGCYDMWDGVYASFANSLITVRNSKVYHSINGIVSENCAYLTSVNSEYYDNWHGITIRDCSSPNQNILLYGNSFSTQYSTPYLKAPYSSFHLGNAGIYLEGIAGVTQGASGLTNTSYFENLSTGITAYRSDFKCINSRFTNINNIDQLGIGILSRIDYSPGDTLQPIEIVDQQSEINVFDRCFIGIQTYSSSELNIRGNRFNSCYYGVNLTHNGLAASIQSPPIMPRVRVTNNNFKFCVAGIISDEITNQNSSKAFIAKNTIGSVIWGIWSRNGSRTTIHFNDVLLSPLSAQPIWPALPSGIVAEGGLDQIISANNVLGSDVNSQFGIIFKRNAGNNVNCNYTSNVTAGITSWGFNLPSRITCNQMKDEPVGFFANNTSFGQQLLVGNTPTASKNRWLGFIFNRTYNYYSNYLTSSFFYSPFVPEEDASTPIGSYTGFPIMALPSTNSLTCLCPRSGSPDSSGAEIDTTQIMRAYYEFARNLQADSGKEYTKAYQDYRIFKDDSTGFYTGQNISYIDSLKNLPLAKLADIGWKLRGLYENTDSVSRNQKRQNLLNAIQSAPYSEKIDSATKSFLQLYIQKGISNLDTMFFTASEWESIRKLAQLCPEEYGNSVYEARSLLSVWKGEWYRHECEGYYMNPDKNNSILDQVIQQYHAKKPTESPVENMIIYPNPGRGQFQLKLSSYTDGDVIRLEVFNIQGKKVWTQRLNQSSFNVSLTAGVYVFKLFYSGSVYTEKIIILPD